MEIKVYNCEYFDRWKIRYLVFVLIILLVIILSILSNNSVWWIFVFLAAGWYIFYLTKSDKIVSMVIWERGLQIWNDIISWNKLSGFILEYNVKLDKIWNIVIIDNKNSHKIYTIKDLDNNLKDFVKELNNYIPLLENYEYSTLDKILRKLKL